MPGRDDVKKTGVPWMDKLLWQIDDYLQEAEQRADKIIEDAFESPEMLPTLLPAKLGDEITPQTLQSIIDRTFIIDKTFDEIESDPTALDRNIALLRFINACDIKQNLKTLLMAEQSTTERGKWSLKGIAVYFIGASMREMEILDGLILSKDFMGLLHRIKSSRFQDDRYADLRETYEKAGALADKLWKDGDGLLHHEMARYLIDEVFPDLSYNTLKKKLKPLAEKYNRKFGMPGVRKRNE